MVQAEGSPTPKSPLTKAILESVQDDPELIRRSEAAVEITSVPEPHMPGYGSAVPTPCPNQNAFWWEGLWTGVLFGLLGYSLFAVVVLVLISRGY